MGKRKSVCPIPPSKDRDERIQERIIALSACEDCREDMRRCGKALEMPELDAFEERHVFHAPGPESSSALLARIPTKAAVKALACPPSSADELAFKFQTMFVKEVTSVPPESDKMNPKELIPDWVYDYVDYVLEEAMTTKRNFRSLPGEALREENLRPVMNALIAGVCKLFKEQHEVVCEMLGVRYYIKEFDKNENVRIIPVFPPVCGILPMHEKTGYDKETRKRWKGDGILYMKVKLLINGAWQEEYIPVKYIEMKHDTGERDMWQAVLTAVNFQVQRLKTSKPISRMYIEVWNGEYWQYGVLDVFGLIHIGNGQITRDAYNRFKSTLNSRVEQVGDLLPMDTYDWGPDEVGLSNMQMHHESRCREFQDAFKCEFPVPSDEIQAYPVGTLYIDHTPRPLPAVGKTIKEEDIARWLYGSIRCILGNKVRLNPEYFILDPMLHRAIIAADTNEHIISRVERLLPPQEDITGRTLTGLVTKLKEKDDLIAGLEIEVKRSRAEAKTAQMALGKVMMNFRECS